MNYINGYTNSKDILADFVETLCWNGENEIDNWFLEYPVAENVTEARELILEGKRATLTTMYSPDKMWIKNELFTTDESMSEGIYLRFNLTDPLSLDAQVTLTSGEKKVSYYRTKDLKGLDVQEFYVDYLSNSILILNSNFNSAKGVKILIGYEAFTNDAARWYVELDYTNRDKNHFSYKFGKEVDSEGRIVNKKLDPPEGRVYWHSLNQDTLPVEDWIPIEFFMVWDYKSINFVFCEDPVFQEDLLHGWGYIGALEELKESTVTDFKGNFGAVGTYGFNEKDPSVTNSLPTSHLIMFESHSRRPYPYYEVGMYSEAEFGQKTGQKGDSGHTGRYASSKIVASEAYENERGYLRNVVATSKYGKSHKDPFVKFKEDNERETQFIYLDLLENSRNLFSKGNNTMMNIALQLGDMRKRVLGDIVFKSVDIDTEEVLDETSFKAVESAELRVPEMIVRGEEDLREEFILIGEDYFKHIIYVDGQKKEHVFKYSQRYGDFTFNFISSEEEAEILKDPVVYTKRVSITHTNTDERIHLMDGLKKYRLNGVNSVTLSAEKPKDDKSYDYIYDLLKIGFKSEYRDHEDEEVVIASDIDHGVEPFHKITPPAVIGPDEDGLNKYNLVSHPVGKEIVVYSNDDIDQKTIRFLYELVTSIFVFNYLNQDKMVIAPQERYEDENSIEKMPPLLIHDEEFQDDDEYYELNADEIVPVRLIANDEIQIQTVDFHYDRILGNIVFKYMDNEEVEFKPETNHSQITSAVDTAPETYAESTNVYYQLKEGEENPVRLIVTPEERELEHIFNYQKRILPATLKMSIDTSCDYMDGMQYLIYEQDESGNDKVVMILDQMNGAESGSYAKTAGNIRAEVDFEHYRDPIRDTRKLKWNCEIFSDGYGNPLERTFKIGGINTQTNEHICDYGHIEYVGYTPGGLAIESKEKRVLAHALSYTDWKPAALGEPYVGMTINTGGNPKEYPNVHELASVDLSKYLVDEVYNINQTNTKQI